MMARFYDVVIFSFLAIDALAIVFIFALYWRKKLKTAAVLIFIAILGIGIVSYGGFIEPRILRVSRHEISLGGAAPVLRIALISDFHLGFYKNKKFAEKVAAKLSLLKPDIVIAAGDFLFGPTGAIKDISPLASVKPPLGKFAVLGNHDYFEDDPSDKDPLRPKIVSKTLQAAGVNVLENGSVGLEHAGKKFLLLGTDEVWVKKNDVKKALDSAASMKDFDGGAPKILISHNPDIIHEAVAHGIDLVLAGHTHGGQIRLPGIGPVPEIPTKLGNRYDKGLFKFGKTQLFITSGLGETGPRARLFVPPEIAMLEVKL